MTDLAGPGVRALVIGTATHTGPVLPPVPAAARSAHAVAEALTEFCGAAAGNVRVLIDPPRAIDMAEAVAEAAAGAESVLLVYFVGHGLLDAAGELHLAAVATDTLKPGLSGHQALAFSALRQALIDSPAAAVVLILDCCFSGRAQMTPTAATGFTPPPVRGAYVLASAENLADAPAGAELTTFTGALVTLLAEGDGRAGRLLTLDVVADRLVSRLQAAGAPLPRRQSGDTAGSLVLAVNRAAPATTEPEPPAEGICPYLGLTSFGPQDAQVYFGRSDLTERLLTQAGEAAAAGRPLLVVGASGSGKSSLVQAGLVASLAGGGLPGSARWPVVAMTPGDQPNARLRKAGASDRRTVVVVDQLEQLFTLCPSAAERTEFLTALTGLAANHLVVLALRADFYAQAAEHPELRAALEHQFLVTAMTPDELRAAIEGPAQVGGLRLEGGLADVILLELGAGDRLPLLSHTLWATWRNREGNRLTVGGYRAAGGVERAVATSAEEVYEGLGVGSREALRRMLPRLVQVGDNNTPDTVRPAARDELLKGEADEQALEAFTAARLLTQDRDTVRLSHEALLRAWPRLVEWLDEDRDWLRTSQRLAADAEAWIDAGRDPAQAYRGSRLATAREGAHVHDLPPDSAEFLAVSEGLERRSTRLRRAVTAALVVLLVLTGAGAAVALWSQRETVAQRQLALESRNRALARALTNEASRLRQDQPGLSKQLAAVAYRLDPAEGGQAVLNSAGVPGQLASTYKAFDLASNSAGKVLVLATGQELVLWDAPTSTLLSRIDSLFTGPVTVSPDGRVLAAAAGSLDGGSPVLGGTQLIEQPRPEVRLWDISDPRRPRLVRALPTGTKSITTLAFAPDGRLLAGAGTGGTIRLWDTGNPASPRELPPLTGHRGRVDSVTFAPVGHLMASSGADGTVRLWDLTDPARPAARARLTGSNDPLEPEVRMIQHRVSFDPTGKRLAFVALEKAINAKPTNELPALYDVSDPRRPHPVYQQPAELGCGHIYAILLLDNAVITSCYLGTVQTWVRGASHTQETLGQSMLVPAARMPTTTGASLQTGALLARPDAAGLRTVAVAGTAGVFVWDVTDPGRSGPVATTVGGPNGFSIRVQFNPAGPPLMAETSGRDGTRLLDVSDPRHPELAGAVATTDPLDGWYGQEAGAGFAFRPDGAVAAATKIVKQRPHVVLLSTSTPDGPPLAEITTGLDYGAAALSFSADGRLLAVADHEAKPHDDAAPSVKIFDVADPARPRLLSSFPALSWDLAFAPKGRLIAVFTRSEIILRDLTDPARPRTLRGFRFPTDAGLTTGVFTPDGTHLIAGDSSQQVRVFGIAPDGLSGEPGVFLGQGGNGNTMIAISSDGRTLALPGDYDADEVDLWDISKPELPRVRTSLVVPDRSGLDVLAFSPDGRFLAVKKGVSVELWSIDPALVIGTLCRLGSDAITTTQWDAYVGHDVEYQPPCS
ncbi:caspase family protein [Actinoplanes sp. NPDC051513]|uniref:caspase, EACC1-associated type n=1 Tax=Actinoplanes sp. NPDC051513 TaxID=3363908 RepID=UPI00378DA22F